jgi:small conductance mechanosensitive channel
MNYARRILPFRWGWVVLVLWLLGHGVVHAQAPGVPGMQGLAGPNAQVKAPVAPVPEKTDATVATPSGPIVLEKSVKDPTIREALEHLLPKYPGVRTVQVELDHGVVTLEGQVENEDVLEGVTQFTRRVEGVRLVLNRMQTDAQVLTAWRFGATVLERIWKAISREWLLVVIAVVIFIASISLARLLATYSEKLLAPFISNVMLRSVAGSLLSTVVVVAGLLLALFVLDLTHLVLSILGIAGMVGLAVGFAFRDITENFIASILLGTRRPFRIGDYIQVAGQAGVVKSLNTRATVLVTLEGKQIRIPNNIIYKEILINASASPTAQGTFDVLIPYEASTAAAITAITQALSDQEGVLHDPPPRVLVEALETNGIRLRAYYWVPVEGVDGLKLLSDLRLKSKVALQQAGIAPPPMGVLVSIIGRVPVELLDVNGRSPSEATLRPRAVVTPAQADVNMRMDKKAAENLSAVPANGETSVVDHVMSSAETHVSEEGTNLLAEPAAAQGSQPGEGSS